MSGRLGAAGAALAVAVLAAGCHHGHGSQVAGRSLEAALPLAP